jgi:hypothetical protein
MRIASARRSPGTFDNAVNLGLERVLAWRIVSQTRDTLGVARACLKVPQTVAEERGNRLAVDFDFLYDGVSMTPAGGLVFVRWRSFDDNRGALVAAETSRGALGRRRSSRCECVRDSRGESAA